MVMWWRQVCAPPNYEQRRSGRLWRRGIPPSVVVGAGADTRIPRLFLLSQYFIEFMSVAAQMSRSSATMGSTCRGVDVKKEKRSAESNGGRKTMAFAGRGRKTNLGSLFHYSRFFSCRPSFHISPQAVISSTSG